MPALEEAIISETHLLIEHTSKVCLFKKEKKYIYKEKKIYIKKRGPLILKPCYCRSMLF